VPPTYVDVNCFHCDLPFKKELKRYNYNIKRNSKNVCSECHKKSRQMLAAKRPANPFCVYMKNANKKIKRERNKNNPRPLLLRTNLNLEYLENLWNEQEGKCAFSNIKLVHPRETNKDEEEVVGGIHPYQASLDRIDSSRGYVKGNVQFVCYMGNSCKNAFTEEQMIYFCQKVAEKNKEQSDEVDNFNLLYPRYYVGIQGKELS
jgi:hypothetical protein